MTKKYKRALSILLAVALFFGMCSCGKQPVVNEAEPSVSAEPTSKPTATPEPATTSEPDVTEGFTTQFEYDLDGDGQKETYIFGVAFNNVLRGKLITNERIGIQESDRPTRDPFPCVWKYATDGTMVVAKEFAALLSQSETQLFCLTDAPQTQPQVTKLNSNWQGGIQIRFTGDHHGIWMYAVSAVLDGEVLYAEATTTIAVSGKPEPTLDSLKTDSNPTTTSEPSATSKPATTPESTIDLFLVEDNIVDSTNDIIIDIYAFIEECNKAHEAITRTTYSEEWYQTYAPDFHDSLDLVSKDEAELLLTTTKRGNEEICTKEGALEDIDLMFRVFKSFYGPYYYFGGDTAFDQAKANMINEINICGSSFKLAVFKDIVARNLSFVKDRHMNVGGTLLGEYNEYSVKDFYVRDLYFYQDDVGYYTKKYDKKWYLTKVGSDTTVDDYLKISIDEKGQLCYVLGISVPVSDSKLDINKILLTRGTYEVIYTISWSKFQQRPSYYLDEVVTVKNGIPLLTLGGGSTADPDETYEDEQNRRVEAMGPDMLSQDVFIFDALSGCGFQSLFNSTGYSGAELYLYKLSNTAEYFGRWNMPWSEASIGEFAVSNRDGKWGKNDTLVFLLQDINNFSAGECSIGACLAVENVVTVGGSTGGTAGPSGATNQHIALPNTGLFMMLGATLHISAGYTEDGFCFEPDIFINPIEAVDALYRLCEFYGIENTADTSVLDKYQSPHG